MQDKTMIEIKPFCGELSPTASSTTQVNHPSVEYLTCAASFDNADGRRVVIVGSNHGVWSAFQDDPKSMRRVLDVKEVKQCAVLMDCGIFVILAKTTLYAYLIEALTPSDPPTKVEFRNHPQNLSGRREVLFFRVGALEGRSLILYRKQRQNDSVFRILEARYSNIQEATSSSGHIKPTTDWFQVYKEFFLPGDSLDVLFLKTKLAIITPGGFHIMDPSSFANFAIPSADGPKDQSIVTRCESAQGLGIFPSKGFVLVYDKFCVFVDKHGDPQSSSAVVEWDHAAEHVALCGDFMLLFNPQSIEVRHLEDGHLVQTINGENIRCLCDGRSAVGIQHGDSRIPSYAPIYAVMEAGTSKQHVVELRSLS